MFKEEFLPSCRRKNELMITELSCRYCVYRFLVDLIKLLRALPSLLPAFFPSPLPLLNTLYRRGQRSRPPRRAGRQARPGASSPSP